jgi:solute carrier family 25, member 33/36
LRTRLREQRAVVPGAPHKYTGLLQALKLIAKEEGVAGLYGGMSTHLLRVVPNAAIMFWTYEKVVRELMEIYQK